MKRNSEKVDSLDRALDLIGKKFDLQIIEGIGKKRIGFNQLLKEIPKTNPRTLSNRLKAMEQNKLITKGLILGTPVKTEYSLTPKAEKLLPIIDQLKKWGE